MTTLRTAVATLLVVVLVALVYIYVGFYDVAADSPHSPAWRWLAETTRERSIAVRSINVNVPELDSPTLIAAGANEYAQMCVGCHLAPGVPDNELRRGLHPIAPPLAGPEFARDASEGASARRFWIVKHGIRASAMPAWGMTHDDDTIWSIVAFLRKLPDLKPEEYAQMTRGAAEAHHHAATASEAPLEAHHDAATTTASEAPVEAHHDAATTTAGEAPVEKTHHDADHDHHE